VQAAAAEAAAEAEAAAAVSNELDDPFYPTTTTPSARTSPSSWKTFSRTTIKQSVQPLPQVRKRELSKIADLKNSVKYEDSSEAIEAFLDFILIQRPGVLAIKKGTRKFFVPCEF